MQPQPCQNLHWYPLTSTKNIWPIISVAYFAKWFQSIFTVGEWRMYPFNLPLLAATYIPTQSCKRASFWSLNPTGVRNHKPELGPSPTLIFEARFWPESQIYRGSYDMRNCGVTKNVVFWYSRRQGRPWADWTGCFQSGPAPEGPRATATNLRKLTVSIEAVCVAPERGPQFLSVLYTCGKQRSSNNKLTRLPPKTV